MSSEDAAAMRDSNQPMFVSGAISVVPNTSMGRLLRLNERALAIMLIGSRQCPQANITELPHPAAFSRFRQNCL